MTSGRTDWHEFASFLREVRAVAGQWDSSGNLLSLSLEPSRPDLPQEEPQQSESPAEREQRARDQRRAIASRASGGPVPKLSGDIP